jgi:hypothetical protein
LPTLRGEQGHGFGFEFGQALGLLGMALAEHAQRLHQFNRLGALGFAEVAVA